MSGGLLERDEELAALRRTLDEGLSGDGRVLAVEGPPGIGKSRLLEALVGLAHERGATVLRARAGELEQEYGFGIVRQLFEPLVAAGRADRLLQGAARPAAAVIGGPAVPPPAGDPSLPVLHGLYWLTANLTADGPLVLVVDDAHWADPASVRWLDYLERRIEGLPLLLAIAARPSEPGTDRALLDTVLNGPSVRRLQLRPLSLSATRALVEEALGGAVERVADACHQVTGGNPFLLDELLRHMGTETSSSPDQIVALVRGLGVPTISRAVLARVARTGGDAVRLARAASILGDGSRLREVSDLAGLDMGMSAGVSDALVVAGVFASADPVAFVHPIVRSGIYRDIGDAERAALHGRAAEQLMTAGEPSDRVASHILRASPAGRDAFVGQLIDAGGRALQRGAPDATVACLRRALDEPPPAPARVAVLRMLGIAEMMLSDAGAATHLKEARNLATEPSDRTEISRALALVHTMSARLPEAVEVLDSAIDELSPTDSEAAMAIEAHLVNIARVHPEMWPIARRRTEGLAERLANRGSGERSHAERLALVQVAVEATSTIRPASEVRRIALDAWDEGRLLIEEGLESPPVVLAGLVLLFSDAFDEARALFDAALEDAVNRGSPSGAAHVLCFRAHVHLRTGSVAEAETDARVSIDAVETPQPLIFPMQLAALIEALVERSEIAEAQSVLERYGYDGPVPGVYHDLHLLCSRGRLRLAQGRTEDARNDLMLAGERHQGWGMPNPAILGWRAWAAHAHVAIGDRDTAMRLASEDVEMARSFGAPRALGIGLRALAGAVGRKDGIDLLREADAVLEGSQARLEHARVLADLGAALRRTNRRTEAREPLTRALDIAQRCGATGLVEHAETELRATGARPRRAAATGAAALTPSEARIAKMAANGMRNREIAQQLFVTVKTVEDHLSHAYAKLGIRSRDELTRVLSS